MDEAYRFQIPDSLCGRCPKRDREIEPRKKRQTGEETLGQAKRTKTNSVRMLEATQRKQRRQRAKNRTRIME